ncbi:MULTISPECIES: hypothetical protein [Acidiphilium]|uniref:hypothetical protein n=2 Tax=Acidocellaceae TaxID=3385905 RepID=UPI00257F28A8|nr:MULTISPECIES: hypothetical protein [Acidiphilium]HQT86077.1 hypothetical protein [Acidiphilium rubrum]
MLFKIAPYIAVIVSLIIWALSQNENRKHEIFKERLKRRVDMFDGLLPDMSKFVDAMNHNSGIEVLQNAANKIGSYRAKMMCYGTMEEQEIYIRFIDSINEKEFFRVKNANAQLVSSILKSIRSEIGME